VTDEDAKHWARTIRSGSRSEGIDATVGAINRLTASGGANRADVIVACAFVLAQNIPAGGDFIAAEMRHGIMALIDGFAMKVAMEQGS
jgi:hypothetical protein